MSVVELVWRVNTDRPDDGPWAAESEVLGDEATRTDVMRTFEEERL